MKLGEFYVIETVIYIWKLKFKRRLKEDFMNSSCQKGAKGGEDIELLYFLLQQKTSSFIGMSKNTCISIDLELWS